MKKGLSYYFTPKGYATCCSVGAGLGAVSGGIITGGIESNPNVDGKISTTGRVMTAVVGGALLGGIYGALFVGTAPISIPAFLHEIYRK